ncbi:MAG: ubiquinol-cytochrome C chaperone family protein [Geminicoccaceae bacterium]
MAQTRQAEAGPFGRWRARAAAKRQRLEAAHQLYVAAVGLARDPVLYARWGVPDTNDGRLEMIQLHAGLVMRRLGRGGEDARALGQELFDVMFADIDRNLRELGVGDLSVGKKVKAIAASFFGRLAGLEAAVAAGDAAALGEVLRRNVFPAGSVPAADQVEALARHLLALDRRLAGVDEAELLAGRLGASGAPGVAD